MGMLDGKVALVTGGASGIGRGTALRFAQEGAAVAILDMQEDKGAEILQELEQAGGQGLFISCDVADASSVESAVQATIERFGRLDIVFANAGVNGVWAPIEELTPEEWDRTFAINLKGTFLTVRYSIPHLRAAGGGSIIVTSSINGNRIFASAGASAYSASKAGQVAFVKMAALELGRDNIRVNAICPGAIHTNIGERTHHRNTEKIAVKREFPQGIPALNRGQGEPADVADVCLFLASPLSRHVSGVDIYIDGGSSLIF